MKNELKARLMVESFITILIFMMIGPWVYFVQLKKINTFPIAQLSITIPEGYNTKQIAEKFKRFPNFNAENFLLIAQPKEGYLFPDTYFFSGQEDEYNIVARMEKTFEQKVEETDRDIIIMASILEKEVQTKEDKKIVSGVLWKRINAGKLLQVDATLAYINDKTSREMTMSDLGSDSPYNTYIHKGLPPGPISNPGLEAIGAAQNPQESPYWFYLSDKAGNTHFAKTFEDHKLNKQKYLW